MSITLARESRRCILCDGEIKPLTLYRYHSWSVMGWGHKSREHLGCHAITVAYRKDTGAPLLSRETYLCALDEDLKWLKEAVVATGTEKGWGVTATAIETDRIEKAWHKRREDR